MTEVRPTTAGQRAKKPQIQLRVMVIDPNPNTRHHLKDALRGMPIIGQVGDRGSLIGLIDVIRSTPMHAVLIEEIPGDEDVFKIIQEVKKDKASERTHFVLMSEELDDAKMERGKKAGFRAFVQKPYDLGSLEKAILDAVGIQLDANGMPIRISEGLRETLDKLRKVQIFSGFSDNELIRLLKICRTRNFEAGSYIFREGDQGLSLYVLVAGKLEIRHKDDDRVLVNMGPGDCFGEIAIIDDGPRSAHALAATNCTAIEVNASVVNNNEDIISLKLVRQIAILLANKLRLQSM